MEAGQRPFNGTTIFALLRFLTRFTDGPVVDRTGLTGDAYDFDINKLLDFTELAQLQRTDKMSARDYVLAAVRDMLGLKLESRKESMEVLVIDHAESLSPN